MRGPADLLFQFAGGSQRPVRIAQEFARHKNQVGLIFGEDIGDLLLGLDQSDSGGGNVRVAADAFGERNLKAGTGDDFLIHGESRGGTIHQVHAQRL